MIVQVASLQTGMTKVETFHINMFDIFLFLSGLPCVFPFTDKEGTIHHRCTTADDPYGEKWCATKTDQDHSVLGWGHCSPGCQDREDRGQTNIENQN